MLPDDAVVVCEIPASGGTVSYCGAEDAVVRRLDSGPPSLAVAARLSPPSEIVVLVVRCR